MALRLHTRSASPSKTCTTNNQAPKYQKFASPGLKQLCGATGAQITLLGQHWINMLMNSKLLLGPLTGV
jgi:hypothetical protein